MRNYKSANRRRKNGGGRFFELLILIALPVALHYLFPLKQLINGPIRLSGILVMLIGLYLANCASKAFREAGTGFNLKDGGTTLVTSGPFRFSRNPIYLGMFIWLLGFAILLGSAMAFLFPITFFILANFLLIGPEEKMLKKSFGKTFTEYCKQVRRWV